jgi:hypothetical protein
MHTGKRKKGIKREEDEEEEGGGGGTIVQYRVYAEGACMHCPLLEE